MCPICSYVFHQRGRHISNPTYWHLHTPALSRYPMHTVASTCTSPDTCMRCRQGILKQRNKDTKTGKEKTKKTRQRKSDRETQAHERGERSGYLGFHRTELRRRKASMHRCEFVVLWEFLLLWISLFSDIFLIFWFFFWFFNLETSSKLNAKTPTEVLRRVTDGNIYDSGQRDGCTERSRVFLWMRKGIKRHFLIKKQQKINF